MTISKIHGAIAAVLMLGASSTSAFAHPPKSGEKPHTHGPRTGAHPHALNKDEIIDRAKTERDRLIREQKVDSAWQSAAEPTLEEKVFNGRPEWVVTFRHPAPTDKAKETLNIFLTSTGRFVAANHTGR